MSKRCPDCGFENDDELSFCHACGEPLDADLRLIQQIKEGKAEPGQEKAVVYMTSKDKRSAKPKRDIVSALLTFLIVLCLLSAAALTAYGLALQFGLIQ